MKLCEIASHQSKGAMNKKNESYHAMKHKTQKEIICIY